MATELILAKSIEELTPALIAFNNEELMAYASRVVAKYSGRIYGEEEMKEAKSDRADIRKIIDMLNAERIRIKKIYNAPMDAFTDKINEVIGRLNDGVKEIDGQVKASEEAAKKQKYDELKAYFNEQAGELLSVITYEKIADVRWLNATVTEKKAKAEIDAKLEDINSAIEVIKGLDSENENILLTLYFRELNLTKALAENDRLNRERERAEELRRRREEAAKVVVEEPVKVIEEKAEEPIQNEEKVFTVLLEVTGTSATMKGLMEYLKSNNIAVKAMKKE